MDRARTRRARRPKGVATPFRPAKLPLGVIVGVYPGVVGRPDNVRGVDIRLRHRAVLANVPEYRLPDAEILAGVDERSLNGRIQRTL